MSSSPLVLEARQLVVKYKQHRAIDALNLGVPRGCVYALLGGNGAGKSSTISTFLTFNRPTSGQVLIEGESPHDHPDLVRAKNRLSAGERRAVRVDERPGEPELFFARWPAFISAASKPDNC
ncbi:ATP-binding cassette domain-containing protein [Methylomonas montana]|uniref:ATP-binding cassette domain-containing protein n=1 Tax=Methylomonas montana TaxID=3058963 RepID=UPI00265A7314|nr:ATP-binding cassette domain-containing protein [Methylomonas montana]WKJ89624.1 ATP-binding cassette domain-containing protein [Methylomonas montana]